MTIESSGTIPWYRFNIWAVLAGAASDVISSNLTTGCFSLVFAVATMPGLINQGVPLEEAQTQLTAQIVQSPVTFVLGTLCSILGGYIAGRIAKFHEVKHALVSVGVLYVFSLLLNLIISKTLVPNLDMPFWLRIAGTILTIGGQALGGYMAYWQRTNKSVAKPQT